MDCLLQAHSQEVHSLQSRLAGSLAQNNTETAVLQGKLAGLEQAHKEVADLQQELTSAHQQLKDADASSLMLPM